MKFDDALCGYSPLSEERIKHVWEHGVFCLDANVLLDVYRYSEQGRSTFLQILRRLKDRIFIPARVAVEFARNRPKVITGHFEPNQMIRRKLNEICDALNSRHKDHPDREELLATVEKMKETEKSAFGEREARQMALLTQDPILDQLVAIVGADVGDPYPDDELKQEYDQRQEANTPPFCSKDHGKNDPVDETYGPEERTGDVAIWLETLAFCEANSAPLVFVTGDLKENWWRYTGERDVPQPALVQEFRRRVGLDVLFYTSERFLEAAPTRLGGEQSEQARKLVEEAKEIERRNRQRPFMIDHFGLGVDYLENLRQREILNELTRRKRLNELKSQLLKVSEAVQTEDGLNRMLAGVSTNPLLSNEYQALAAALVRQLQTPEGVRAALDGIERAETVSQANSFLNEALKHVSQPPTQASEGTSSEGAP